MSVKKTEPADELMAAIARATEDLSFHSESDAPIEPYRWAGDAVPTAAALLKAEGKRADEAVEQLSLHALFDPVTEEQSYWTDEDRAEAQRYKELVALLEGSLGDLRVYQVGKVDIDVYVLGQHPSGQWMGIKTHVVET